MEELTPQQITEQLDKYIIGQEAAKKAIAIALRNRYRRRQLSSEEREDVAPKNIMMIGATGVGKTEIARRVASMSGVPFVKVEATRFTEVGYVGKDVESIMQDLVEASVSLLTEQKMKEVQAQAEKLAEERIIDYVVAQAPSARRRKTAKGQAASGAGGMKRVAVGQEAGRDDQVALGEGEATTEETLDRRRRNRVAKLLRTQRLDDTVIEIEVSGEDDRYESVWEFSTGMSQEEVNEGLKEFIENYSASRKRSRKVSVRDARRILTREEANRLIDYDSVVDQAIQQAEQGGIVFIDEIDKIAGPSLDIGSDISGEGVQRDLLPIIEGSTVMTRYGTVKSDHVLFIAAGSFSRVKPSDLIPELQGRFPLRVELQSLSPEDMRRILMEPKNSLLRQYKVLLATEGVDLQFTEDAITEISETACRMNRQTEDIGARRLQTVVEYVLEDVSFQAPLMKGQTVRVDAEYVRNRVAKVVSNEDLSRYIL